MSKHRWRVIWVPRKIANALTTKDRYRPLDWRLPTRLDQEINRTFVHWKTTRCELDGARAVP